MCHPANYRLTSPQSPGLIALFVLILLKLNFLQRFLKSGRFYFRKILRSKFRAMSRSEDFFVALCFSVCSESLFFFSFVLFSFFLFPFFFFLFSFFFFFLFSAFFSFLFSFSFVLFSFVLFLLFFPFSFFVLVLFFFFLLVLALYYYKCHLFRQHSRASVAPWCSQYSRSPHRALGTRLVKLSISSSEDRFSYHFHPFTAKGEFD